MKCHTEAFLTALSPVYTTCLAHIGHSDVSDVFVNVTLYSGGFLVSL